MPNVKDAAAEFLADNGIAVATVSRTPRVRTFQNQRKSGSPEKNQGARSGWRPMSARACNGHGRAMARYLLCHRHQPHECRIVFTSFKGGQSPLRHHATLASCPSGGHEIWWTVHAETGADALGLLPYYVAQRTTVTRVSEVEIP